MKIAFNHISERIISEPSIDEVSKRLFQLGHEHEIEDQIIDLELTPNRGDCLSVDGILRDLALFYDIKQNNCIYEKDIRPFDIEFTNNATKACPKIAFMKIEIDEEIDIYKGALKQYFEDLNLKKNNFFTDISNYLSYETGQPTHCYDGYKIKGEIKLSFLKSKKVFNTLLNKQIQLEGKNLVFSNNGNVINLAGVIGGLDTSCSSKTRTVIVECAYFNPDEIIGKTIKYDINSDAAYKFERGVDPQCHERVLRRFLKIVQDHAIIKSAELFISNTHNQKVVTVESDINRINNILGTKISNEEFLNYLEKLSFAVEGNSIKVPSFRNDIRTKNDIAEEIARAIGYDNIPIKKIKIPSKYKIKKIDIESQIKSYLIDNGFFEVINNPFENNEKENSIKIDNPLDSNKCFLRTDLKNSLINNLLYNERRQQDSVKLFELSDIYTFSKKPIRKRVLGIIASGRVAKNYKDFSKKIKNEYLHALLKKFISQNNLQVEDIPRNLINSKLKNPIVYIQVEIENIKQDILNYEPIYSPPKEYAKYKTISEYPSSVRDLSFSIESASKSLNLERLIMNYDDELLKNVFLFDYYVNKDTSQIKMAFRFTFQSNLKTITDNEVNKVMEDIISKSLKIESVKIPGLK